ncbi:hypothetical protein WG66_007273 [Moniliophthora roreri]|nr:hypothetical protein WG66_007273 [Moniliophthora roreri]
MRYIRILLIGLLFAQTSLAIEALSCRCMDKNNLSVNKGTSDGCAWLMKKKNLFENDAWTSKDQHGIVTCNFANWVTQNSYLGNYWEHWWTKLVCIDHEKLSSANCWYRKG